MTYHFQNPSDLIIADYLKQAKTIAIVGLSDRTDTAAYRVANYLKEAGYTIIPVNPKLAGLTVLGRKLTRHSKKSQSILILLTFSDAVSFSLMWQKIF